MQVNEVDQLPDGWFQLAFEQAEAGMAVVGPAGQPLVLNAALRALLGPDAERLVFAAVSEVVLCGGGSGDLLHLGRGVSARLHDIPGFEGGQHGHLVVTRLAGLGDDGLTGLAGRRALMDRLVAVLNRRDLLRAELVVVDVDDFKRVNDRYGHLIGDEVLVEAASRLCSSVRPADGVFRWGGDEFVILLEDPLTGGGDAVCHRIEQALAEPCLTTAGQLRLAASCGWVATRPGETPTELLHRADLEMYRIKHERKRLQEGWDVANLAARVERNRLRSQELQSAVRACQLRIAATRATAAARYHQRDRAGDDLPGMIG